jgi:hypothetical protein
MIFSSSSKNKDKDKGKEKEENSNKKITKKLSQLPIKSKFILRNKSYMDLQNVNNNNTSELFKKNYNLDALSNTYNNIKEFNEDKTKRNTQIKNEKEEKKEKKEKPTYNSNYISNNVINKDRKIDRANKGKEINIYSNTIIDGDNSAKKSFHKQLNKNIITEHYNSELGRNKLESEIKEKLTINEYDTINNNYNKNNNKNLLNARVNLKKRIGDNNTINVGINNNNDRENT